MTLQEKVEFIYDHTPFDLGAIARKVGCSASTVKNIKRGDNENCGHELAQRIDDLFIRAKKAKRALEG